MNIDNRIVHFFKAIDFAERYITICEKHSEVIKSLDNYDLGLIQSFYLKNDIKMTFSKREKFFKNSIKIKEFTIQFNVIPKNGCLQFVFDFKIGKERLSLGWGMWESITEELLEIEYTRKPTFCSVKELEEVLNETTMIYSDLKSIIQSH